MSGGLDVLALREDDVTKFLSCHTHIGVANLDFQMEQYVFKRRNDGEGNLVIMSNLCLLPSHWDFY